jgi:hypothetical protein
LHSRLRIGPTGDRSARSRAPRKLPKIEEPFSKIYQELAEFVSGNMLFVLHEMARVSITQLGLPVLGRMEDAEDSFAALRLVWVGRSLDRSSRRRHHRQGFGQAVR